MSVRAKFQVITSVGGSIELLAVTSGSEENKSFFQYTPGGRITMSVVNEAAAEQFAPGDEFYVDFTKAPKP